MPFNSFLFFVLLIYFARKAMAIKVIKPIKTHNIGTRLQGLQAGCSCSKSFKKLIIIVTKSVFYHIGLCIAITTCDTDEALQFKIALEWLMNEVSALHSSMTNPFISPTLFVHFSLYFSTNSLTNSKFAFE